jgi:hypothetical protein
LIEQRQQQSNINRNSNININNNDIGDDTWRKPSAMLNTGTTKEYNNILDAKSPPKIKKNNVGLPQYNTQVESPKKPSVKDMAKKINNVNK